MSLRDLFERLGVPHDVPISVFGVSISPRCGFCDRRFHAADIVMISMESATRGCGYHIGCQLELDRCEREGAN